ncbi:MAG TPA: hypothetical protein VJX73_02795 [Terracidiphilus sp.]|nr:hypothetical protein [Terracidiphilus sp.]
MKLKWFAVPLIGVAIGLAGSFHWRAYAAAPQQGPGYAQDQPGWDAPPAEFRDVQRQGFHDGIEGARQDFDHHRMPDVNNRKEYRHPHVDPAVREDYREGFRRGYDIAMHHMRDHMDDRDHDHDHDHDQMPH